MERLTIKQLINNKLVEHQLRVIMFNTSTVGNKSKSRAEYIRTFNEPKNKTEDAEYTHMSDAVAYGISIEAEAIAAFYNVPDKLLLTN